MKGSGENRVGRYFPSLSGRAYWRSLEEYADTPEFRQWAQKEFPDLAHELDAPYRPGGVGRRRFLQLMGASMALAGLTGVPACRRQERRIRAYQQRPEEIVPGRPLYYATTFVLAGQAIGLLAETHEGRATKLEGNPSHPLSLGATDVFAQGSVLDLYDPDRSRVFLRGGRPARREDFLAFLDQEVAHLRREQGAGLAILSEDYASPAIEMLREHLAEVMPQATFHVYEPGRYGHEQAALDGVAEVDLSRAAVVLALDSDLLGLEDEGIRHKRAFADGRRVRSPADAMNRLYVVEPHFTPTGSAADHRLRLAASRIGQFAAGLAAELGAGVGADETAQIEGIDPRWITELAADLREHAGRCAVVAGQRQPAEVHRLAAQMNEALGNVGRTVRYVRRGGDADGISELAQRIAAGEVRTLVILGGNPAYNAPADLRFGALLRQVPNAIRLGLHEDETSALCAWHVPGAHSLESWGDARAADGTISPIQPMIDPLFGGMTPLELLARTSGYDATEPYDIVRRSCARIAGEADFENTWRRFLHEGLYRGTGFQPVAESPAQAGPHGLETRATTEGNPVQPLSLDNIEICFAVDHTVFDGRFANNGWMQECPDPMTRITWDNAAILSPRTGRELGVQTGDIVQITLAGRGIELPVFLMPGHADYSITLPLGYGRTRVGSLGTAVGANAFLLRTSDSPGFATGARLERTGRRRRLATTQDHHSLDQGLHSQRAFEQRGIIRETGLDHYREHPDFVRYQGPYTPTLRNIHRNPLEDFKQDPLLHQWGMSIDLTACVNCSACVIACQAENNVPIVGRDEVIKGREMHWLRMDRYFSGTDPEGEVEVSTQPMFCQHCDNAPCEPVCPVNATVQSPEGLNEMVYNRCVGTRYCSNNCPYKVRRFNYFDWNKGTIRESDAPFDGRTAPDPTRGFTQPQMFQPPLQEMLRMQKNPDVTVRMRGVMEKCTFCVQRIQSAKVAMKIEAGQDPVQKVPDGTIMTACEQACPTRAIVFGDLTDSESRVSQLKALDRDYSVLEHLNTRPRLTYLARLRNRNPRMPRESAPVEPRADGRISLPVLGEGGA